LVLDWSGGPLASGPVLPDLRAGGGMTVSLRFRGSLPSLGEQRTLVSAFSEVTAALGEEPTTSTITKGWSITVDPDGELELFVTDGFGTSLRHRTGIAASSDVWDGDDHVVTFVVDGGPKVVSVAVDERLDDGGSSPQGWAFFPKDLGEVGGSELQLAPSFGGALSRVLFYDRALLTTEAIGIARALRNG
jgi:hypothetical protein